MINTMILKHGLSPSFVPVTTSTIDNQRQYSNTLHTPTNHVPLFTTYIICEPSKTAHDLVVEVHRQTELEQGCPIMSCHRCRTNSLR